MVLEHDLNLTGRGRAVDSEVGRGTHDMEASDTFIRGRSRSSLRRELSSFSRRNLRSAMLCFLFLTSPPARISYGMPSNCRLGWS